MLIHPGGNPWANLKSISHRCHLFEVAFVWELTKETIHLPLGCLQGGGELIKMRHSGCLLMDRHVNRALPYRCVAHAIALPNEEWRGAGPVISTRQMGEFEACVLGRETEQHSKNATMRCCGQGNNEHPLAKAAPDAGMASHRLTYHESCTKLVQLSI